MWRIVATSAGLFLLGGCAGVNEPIARGGGGTARRENSATVVSSPGQGGRGPAIQAVSAILMDARTGETIYEKNADVVRPVASTQKLLTALIAVHCVPVTGAYRPVVAPRYVVDDGGRDSAELFHSLLVESDNSAADELAERSAGSRGAFVAEMNRKAWEVGARKSHFVDPHGVSAQQHSTARDMAEIARRAWNEPLIRRMMSTRNHTVTSVHGTARAWSTDADAEMAWPMCDGIKTGYTSAAGQCLVSVGRAKGRELVLVQLGSRASAIYSDGERVMRWAVRGGSASGLLALN